MGEIVRTPPDSHHCRPGWKHTPLAGDSQFRAQGYTHRIVPDPDLFNAAPSTVWRCVCGKTWVARENVVGRCYARWVPESRLARWFRERRHRG